MNCGCQRTGQRFSPDIIGVRRRSIPPIRRALRIDSHVELGRGHDCADLDAVGRYSLCLIVPDEHDPGNALLSASATQ
jgi:hypothetical protein